MNQDLSIIVSDPPADLPHSTFAEDIKMLSQFLSARLTRDDGTEYIVTSAAYRDSAGNAGRIYIPLDASTNAILGIFSKVDGVWTQYDFTASDGVLYFNADNKTVVAVDGETIKEQANGITDTTDPTYGKKELYVPLGGGLKYDSATGTVMARVDGTTIQLQDLELGDGSIVKQLYSPLATPVYYVQAEYYSGSNITIGARDEYVQHDRELAKIDGNMEVDPSGDYIIVTEPGYYFVSAALTLASWVPNTEIALRVFYRQSAAASWTMLENMCRYSNYSNATLGAVVVGADGETYDEIFNAGFQHITASSPTRVVYFPSVSSEAPGHIKIDLVINSVRDDVITLYAYNLSANYPYFMTQSMITVGYLGSNLA